MRKMIVASCKVAALTALCVAPVYAEGYQELTPTAVYSGVDSTYVVFAQNVGTNGCSANRNSIVFTHADHSADLVKTSLTVALTAISTGSAIKVYWSGCLNSGRPKAVLIGLGTTEIN
jgi:hypothetical protein